jgi:hypothetical protein
VLTFPAATMFDATTPIKHGGWPQVPWYVQPDVHTGEINAGCTCRSGLHGASEPQAKMQYTPTQTARDGDMRRSALDVYKLNVAFGVTDQDAVCTPGSSLEQQCIQHTHEVHDPRSNSAKSRGAPETHCAACWQLPPMAFKWQVGRN